MKLRTQRTQRSSSYKKRPKTLWQQYQFGTFNERQMILAKLQTGALTFDKIEATKKGN